MNTSTIDIIIVGCFLLVISLIGVFSGGRQKNMKDYFLGAEKVPWWIVCFSIIAAETSTLTFISIPGLAYLGNLNFLQVTFGYFIGRLIIAKYLLPEYFKGELSTSYAFLESRFGAKTRTAASVVFLLTRTASDGVRLFAAAIPIKLLLGIDYPYAIVIIAAIALLYTFTGGVKAVIWVDSIQMLFYLGGAVFSLYYIVSVLPGGLDTFVAKASFAGKFQIFNLGFGDGSIQNFFAQPYSLFASLIGGIFLSMASHGTDQLVVQRLLATQKLRSGQLALVGSGFIIVVQFALFLFVGVALFVFYDGKQFNKPDEIFPFFILEKLPKGISGLLISALLAAALSTLSSSISALGSSTMFDLFLPNIKKNSKNEKQLLKYSRIIIVLWTVVLVFSALAFMNGTRAMVEIALSIASFTSGGLLGTFLLGLLNKSAKQEDALAGFFSGIFIMVAVISLKLAAWTWFTLIGVVATLVIGSLLALLNKKNEVRG